MTARASRRPGPRRQHHPQHLAGPFLMLGSWLAPSYPRADAHWRGLQRFYSEQKGQISGSFDSSRSAEYANPANTTKLTVNRKRPRLRVSNCGFKSELLRCRSQ